MNRYAESPSRNGCLAVVRIPDRRVDIQVCDALPKSRDARDIRYEVLEKLESLAEQSDRENLRAGEIPTRPREAGDESRVDEIKAGALYHDRDGRRLTQGDTRQAGTRYDQYVDLALHQFSGEYPKLLGGLGVPPLKDEGLAFDPADLPQRLGKQLLRDLLLARSSAEVENPHMSDLSHLGLSGERCDEPERESDCEPDPPYVHFGEDGGRESNRPKPSAAGHTTVSVPGPSLVDEVGQIVCPVLLSHPARIDQVRLVVFGVHENK